MSDTYSTGAMCLYHRLHSFGSAQVRDFDLTGGNSRIEQLLSMVSPRHNQFVQSVRGSLLFMLSHELQKINRYAGYENVSTYEVTNYEGDPPPIVLSPGELIVLSNHENGVAASQTTLPNRFARVIAAFDSVNPASDIAELVDASTSHPVPNFPLALRAWGPVKKHGIKGRGVAMLGPSSLLFISNEEPLYLFLVWVGSSTYIMWHPNPTAIPDAILHINSGPQNKRMANTVGYSMIPILNEVICLNYYSLFDRMCDRWVKFDQQGAIKTGLLIPKLLQHLRTNSATWAARTREDLRPHLMLTENSDAVSD